MNKIPAPLSSVNHRILVIDDIVTTGSTAHAVADQLKRGGAAKVRLLALARTP